MEVLVKAMGPEEAAKLLGVSRQSIYTWIRRGRLGRAGEANHCVILVPAPLLANPKATFYFDREVSA